MTGVRAEENPATMKTKTFQQRLDTAFPYDTYANTLRALREGIAAGDDVIKGTLMFSSRVGDDLRGLIRRAGILMRFEEMCKAGDLPFKCALTPMPRGTWHWLDIYSGDCHGHIVRTEDPTRFRRTRRTARTRGRQTCRTCSRPRRSGSFAWRRRSSG